VNNDTIKSAGLLILRLVFGFVMIMHGIQKAFEWTPAGTVASFEQMGIPMAAAASVVSMSGALIFVHLAAGFSASKGGYEYVLTLAAIAAAFFFTGAGKFSIDALFARRQ